MGTRRPRRVGNLIQAELAQLLIRKVKDPRVEGVSLTAVDVSPDLRQAKVFYTVMDDARREEAEAGLIAVSAFLRKELASRLHLKILPRLVPVWDGSITRGMSMDALIRQAREHDEMVSAHEDGDEEPDDS